MQAALGQSVEQEETRGEEVRGSQSTEPFFPSKNSPAVQSLQSFSASLCLPFGWPACEAEASRPRLIE